MTESKYFDYKIKNQKSLNILEGSVLRKVEKSR